MHQYISQLVNGYGNLQKVLPNPFYPSGKKAVENSIDQAQGACDDQKDYRYQEKQQSDEGIDFGIRLVCLSFEYHSSSLNPEWKYL